MNKWNEESIYKAAAICSSRKDFRLKYGGAVNAAKRLGILDELLNHFWPHKRSPSKPKNGIYKKDILNAARSCETYDEFKEKFPEHFKVMNQRSLAKEVKKLLIVVPPRTKDKEFRWVSIDLGREWETWRGYAVEYVSLQSGSIRKHITSIGYLLRYLKYFSSLAFDPLILFRGVDGHSVSNSGFIAWMKKNNGYPEREMHIARVCDFVDWLIKNEFSEIENGLRVNVVTNPFEKIKRIRTNHSQTVRSPLPYIFIQELRNIITNNMDYRSNPSFSDLNYVIRDESFSNGCWMSIDENKIDESDPDCVWRNFKFVAGRKKDDIQIWNPAAAIALLLKLHLPLRTYQVLMLDSGEADTWRYEDGNWELNDRYSFVKKDRKNPLQKGVFRRIVETQSGDELTGIYITTNKSQDRNKDEVDRGYVIPWQHEEVLYWLEKLRNWQEKYNPISKPTPPEEWSLSLNDLKSDDVTSQMGDFCFLFRKDQLGLPLKSGFLQRRWHALLSTLERDVNTKEHYLHRGKDITLANDEGIGTDFPLHSLRVSLITAYIMETDLPLPVVSKLLAGHSRMLMTIYYNKITPSVMTHKMREAENMLQRSAGESLDLWLENAAIEDIDSRCAYKAEYFSSIEASLNNRNPIGWELMPYGICLVGGNANPLEDPAVGGCWNGGEPLIKRASNKNYEYGPVPNGPKNCCRCRFFVTDATYLPQLTARLNQTSYLSYDAAKKADELKEQMRGLKNIKFDLEFDGKIFNRSRELIELERRYEKQQVKADESAKDFIATFELINKIQKIENYREESDESQKLIAVGKKEDIDISLRLIESNSELLQLSLLCEDAEIYPDFKDDLEDTSVLHKRTMKLTQMMMKAGYKPILVGMDEKTQLIVGNALIRKMAMLSDPNDRMQGMAKVASYIEGEHYLSDRKLLHSGYQSLLNDYPVVEGHKLQKLMNVDS